MIDHRQQLSFAGESIDLLGIAHGEVAQHLDDDDIVFFEGQGRVTGEWLIAGAEYACASASAQFVEQHKRTDPLVSLLLGLAAIGVSQFAHVAPRVAGRTERISESIA